MSADHSEQSNSHRKGMNRSSPIIAPLGGDLNVPIPLTVHCGKVHSDGKRRYTKAQEVDRLAIRKYKTNGRGITIHDLLSSGLARHKSQAQNTLKRCLAKNVLFVIENRKPQQYYPSSLKAEILNARLKNAQMRVTEVSYLQSIPVSSTDAIITRTLEDYVLPILRNIPLEIHKIQLVLKLNPDYYRELRLLVCSENQGKTHQEIIASVLVTYLFYPNGKVMVSVACSNTPFKLQSNDDLGCLIAFLGAVRDRLIVYLCDKHERAVPDIMNWNLTQCEINRDAKVGDWLQYTSLNVQVKHAFHLIRLYIKSKGEETFYRVEESISHKNKPVTRSHQRYF